MTRLVLLLAVAGTDAGSTRAKYEFSPCSFLGKNDAGVGGMVCTEPTKNGSIERYSWDDGRREREVWVRLGDGGLSVTRTVLAPDASW